MFLKSRQYRVPTGDGEALINPPPLAVNELLERAPQRPLQGELTQGVSLASWRTAARAEVSQLVGRPNHPGVWLVAGHQPEFFHPGVWLKNAVMAQLAAKHQGMALNLVVDNDVPKSGAIRVPTWRPGIAPEAVAMEPIPFAQPAAEVPFEEWTVQDQALFASFPKRLAQAAKDWPFTPVGIGDWISMNGRVMDAVTKARRAREAAWGLSTVALEVSELCTTRAFGDFVNAIFNDLPRFHQCYNARVRSYRQQYKIKSRHHPVPDLIRDGDWYEAPFWCWTSENPKRTRPFVRVSGTGMLIRLGRRERAWPTTEFKIRPRALTLTLFSRLALADVFIHGIGGGKYDELTDAISMSFFGIALPEFVIVSGTLRLPMPAFPATSVDQHRLHRRERDWQWNPQRLITRTPLAAERAGLIALPIATRNQRRERRRQLRKNLQRWQNLIAAPRLAEVTQRSRCEAELHANRILSSREFPWPLFPESMLQEWLLRPRS